MKKSIFVSVLLLLVAVVPVNAQAAPIVSAHQTAQIYETGWVYYNAEDYAAALPHLKKAADMGNTKAMTTIGEMYRYGKGVSKNESIAIRWYKQAAEAGNIDAMKALEDIYSYGNNANPNEKSKWSKRAFSLCKKLANQGNTDAMCKLGKMYQDGNFTLTAESDFKEALRWYKKAAESGSVTAMYRIAVLYDSDYFTSGLRDQIAENDNESIKWYRKAAEKGEVLSMYSLVDKLSGNGNNADTKEAAVWHEKIVRNLASFKAEGSYKLSLARKLYPIEEMYSAIWLSTTSMHVMANGERMYGRILDNELNLVYKKLMSVLPQNKKNALKNAELKWIKQRDKKAEAAAAEFEGGTAAAPEYASAYNRETHKRLFYLAKYYDDVRQNAK